MRMVRQPAVAGHFYPGLPAVLGRAVENLLDHARGVADPPRRPPKALIVPHAGYGGKGRFEDRGQLVEEPLDPRARRRRSIVDTSWNVSATQAFSSVASGRRASAKATVRRTYAGGWPSGRRAAASAGTSMSGVK